MSLGYKHLGYASLVGLASGSVISSLIYFSLRDLEEREFNPEVRLAALEEKVDELSKAQNLLSELRLTYTLHCKDDSSQFCAEATYGTYDIIKK